MGPYGRKYLKSESLLKYQTRDRVVLSAPLRSTQQFKVNYGHCHFPKQPSAYVFKTNRLFSLNIHISKDVFVCLSLCTDMQMVFVVNYVHNWCLRVFMRENEKMVCAF